MDLAAQCEVLERALESADASCCVDCIRILLDPVTGNADRVMKYVSDGIHVCGEKGTASHDN